MNIAVIGTGNMGSAMAKQLAKAGYGVAVAGRDLGKARTLAASLGSQVVASDARTAAANAEVIILAVQYSDATAVLALLGNLAGKIVVDMSNPLTADYMALTLGHSTSAAETIAASIPDVRLVKAFNTILAQVLNEGPTFAEGRAQVFVAGDDEAAKQAVSAIVERIGFHAMDAGPLKNARYLEPLAGQNIQFAYALGQGVQISPVWLKRAG
jgi:NADPH-dependent F420 reductase